MLFFLKINLIILSLKKKEFGRGFIKWVDTGTLGKREEEEEGWQARKLV